MAQNTSSTADSRPAVSYRSEMEAHARDYLQRLLDEPFTLGTAVRGEEGWYAVPAESESWGSFRVYVHTGKHGPDLRDDRVLDGLDRQMEALMAAAVPEQALCGAYLEFSSGVPARRWYASEELAAVQQGDTLYASLYLALPQQAADALPAALADLTCALEQGGWYATVTAGVMPAETLETLRAADPDEAGLAAAFAADLVWTVDPNEALSGEERLAKIEAEWKEAQPG
ncbi:MAG: hypothetical protein IJ484_02340 [Oscillospiraceae bacterium]|nr:hypothetical protein [Oscillospiraceae bacterium]